VNRSLIRALGLKIGKIVVDAGHGGHDTGTIGPNGLEEKDLVLDVAFEAGESCWKTSSALKWFTRVTMTLHSTGDAHRYRQQRAG